MKINTKLLVLSQKHLSLSIAEAQAQYKGIKTMRKEHYLFVQSQKQYYQRLAFTKEVYDILFSCPKNTLFKKIKKYDWNKKVHGTYCVRSVQQEREIAGMIWQLLKKPQVSLETPKTLIHFFFIGDTVYCCILVWKNDNACLQRKPHTRPGFYPASLDPQLARAMVNLAGVHKGVIVDPFCGTGGILIEAAFSGRKALGFDVSNWMLEKCKTNLAYYGLQRKVKIRQGDATTFRKKCDAIVTELPFGKNTKSQDLELLYSKFLENADRNTKKMVVSFPDFVDFKKIIKKTKWRMKESFLWYIHHSMSKWVVILNYKNNYL